MEVSPRDLLATVGIAVVGLGLVFVLQPGLAAALSIPQSALVLLSAIAFVQGFRAVQNRRFVEIESADPPEVEERTGTPMPGDDFDDRVEELIGRHGSRWVGGDYERIERRLRGAAVAALTAGEGCSPETARERIDDGAWTDDPAAAAFLGTIGPPPWRIRLRAVLSDSRYRFYVRRTVEAIVAVEGAG